MWTMLSLFSSSELAPKAAKAEPSSASTVLTTQWNCDARMAAGRKISAMHGDTRRSVYQFGVGRVAASLSWQMRRRFSLQARAADVTTSGPAYSPTSRQRTGFDWV